MSKTVSKHVIEIRYKPNSRFLDKRGEIAEIISNDFFNHWNIANNRVDFMSKNNTNIGAFLSYRNLGLFSHHPNETKLFIEKAKEFIKSAWDYFPSNKITRIGVRSTYLIEADNFRDIFDKYKKKFLGLNNNNLKSFQGDLIDVCFPLNFVQGEDFFNVTTGPMEKEQSKRFVVDSEELPEAGIFVDVDYFGKEFSPNIKQKDVLEFIDKSISKAGDISKLIQGIINNSNDR